MRRLIFKMENKNIWKKIDMTIWAIEIILVIFSIYIILTNSSSDNVCGTTADINTAYQIIVSLTCNYGILGLIVFSITILIFIGLIILLVKKGVKK